MMNTSELGGQIRAAMGGVIFSMCKNQQVVNEMMRKIDRALSSIDTFEAINERMLESVLYRCFEKVSVVRKEFKAMIWASLVLLFANSPIENSTQVNEFFHYLNSSLDSSTHNTVDPNFADFVRYMRIAQLAMPAYNNQGNLLLICAYLESNGQKPVLDYSTGSGKTDAVKRRLVAYHWFAAHATNDPQHIEKANRYIEELIKSHKKGDSRRKTGNQPLQITLEADELAKLVTIPPDYFDEVFNAPRATVYFNDLDESVRDVLRTLQVLFSDITYFNAIMAPPLVQLIIELITWFGTHRLQETIPDEMKILQRFIGITGKGEEKMIIVIAMMTCKVLVLHKASAWFGAWTGFPSVDSFGLEYTDVTGVALDAENAFLTSFIQAVILANELCSSERLRNKQIVLFEIGQRLEGSGRVYSKGGGESAATKRRLKIISAITGRVRPPRAATSPALPSTSQFYASTQSPPIAPLVVDSSAMDVDAMDVDQAAARILASLSSTSFSSSTEDAMQVLLNSNPTEWMIDLHSRQASIASQVSQPPTATEMAISMSSNTLRQFQNASQADQALSSYGREGLDSKEWPEIKREYK